METVQQIVPISDMKVRHGEVLRRLDNGPVVLAQRSKARAVLVSIEQWDKLALLVKNLQSQLGTERRLRLSNQRYAEALADPKQLVSEDEYEQVLVAAGLAA
jgi:prevent-host-death family protein